MQNIQLGSRQFLWILPTFRRTWFWIFVAHDQLDEERQSGGSINMRCNMVLRQNSVLATSLLVFSNIESEICRESCTIHFRQTHHVLPELLCLRRATS